MAITADSEAIRQKWDTRYRHSHINAERVADALSQNQHLLPPAGTALDLACGLGGNALFLAEKGFEVHAWDISPVAIERLGAVAQQRGLALHSQVRDCLAQPPEANRFDIIVVSRFLERTLCPAISAALRPGGILIYQTYTQERRAPTGPANTHFLLQEGELMMLFSRLERLLYLEGEEAQFIGRKR